MSGDWHCIGSNPASGVSTWIQADGDSVNIQTRQDVSALLDENTAIRNVTAQGWKGDGLHSIARIPLSMLHDVKSPLGEAVKEGDDTYVARFLNNSDFARLRTKEGRV